VTKTRTLIADIVVLAVAVSVAATPKIVSGVILTVGVIAIFTVWAWRKYGSAAATRRMVIPLYGGLFAFVAAGIGVIMWTTALGDYHLCLDRVDRSEKSYQSAVLLYDVIDAVTHTTHYTADVFVPGKPSLRASLLLPLTSASCANYKP